MCWHLVGYCTQKLNINSLITSHFSPTHWDYPRKMWLHFLSNSLTFTLFIGLVSAFPECFALDSECPAVELHTMFCTLCTSVKPDLLYKSKTNKPYSLMSSLFFLWSHYIAFSFFIFKFISPLHPRPVFPFFMLSFPLFSPLCNFLVVCTLWFYYSF